MGTSHPAAALHAFPRAATTDAGFLRGLLVITR